MDTMNRQQIEELLPDGYILVKPDSGNKTTQLHLRCPEGHDWTTPRLHNILRGVRCIHCAKKTNRLPFDEIISRLKMIDLKLVSDYYSSNIPVRVECSKGHQYLTKVVEPSRCNECKRSKNIYRALDDARSEGYKVELTEKRQLVGYCPKGHKYRSTTVHFNNGKRCQECRGNARLTKEFVSSVIQKEGYSILPEEKYTNQTKKMKFVCNFGHQYLSSWAKWEDGIRCSTCNGGLPLTTEGVIKRIEENPNFDYISGAELYEDRKSKIYVKCKTAGHQQYKSYDSLVYEKTGCVTCISSTYSSSGENEIYQFICDLGINAEKHNRSILSGKELDIYIPEKNLAIEFCGLYSHCTMYKDRNYHKEKYDKCSALGIQLLTIFEDEWYYRKDAIKGLIQTKLDIPKIQVGARECQLEIAKYNEVFDFCEAFHVQGKPGSNTKMAWCLSHNGQIMMLLSLGHHHRITDQWLINRICIRPGYSIPGGVERLLKAAKSWCLENNIKELQTFSDNRYSDGGLYERLNFIRSGELKPDYCYTKGDRRYSKQTLKKNEFERGSSKTEWQLRQEQGFNIIYDCGKTRWSLTIS